ncbi:uncharacterized protein MONBRDRAFT_34669 [Monosiga brevicollis MX1]|uniref:Uncharacterized protein n=1 Tax=Monosiga brevicollis TaxID=81824 RepID=A9VD90_MONBE|nr:uncharacterized protein MONBRDRAFT_34669 [Monosiga brevicollis MX1]EDQ84514.1 predicted protein [Monosiga brevicollis MX1]|eukprot:XP_001750701.1 hypothetical protein [Monosiga brevicollis MX1]
MAAWHEVAALTGKAQRFLRAQLSQTLVAGLAADHNLWIYEADTRESAGNVKLPADASHAVFFLPPNPQDLPTKELIMQSIVVYTTDVTVVIKPFSSNLGATPTAAAMLPSAPLDLVIVDEAKGIFACILKDGVHFFHVDLETAQVASLGISPLDGAPVLTTLIPALALVTLNSASQVTCHCVDQFENPTILDLPKLAQDAVVRDVCAWGHSLYLLDARTNATLLCLDDYRRHGASFRQMPLSLPDIYELPTERGVTMCAGPGRIYLCLQQRKSTHYDVLTIATKFNRIINTQQALTVPSKKQHPLAFASSEEALVVVTSQHMYAMPLTDEDRREVTLATLLTTGNVATPVVQEPTNADTAESQLQSLLQQQASMTDEAFAEACRQWVSLTQPSADQVARLLRQLVRDQRHLTEEVVRVCLTHAPINGWDVPGLLPVLVAQHKFTLPFALRTLGVITEEDLLTAVADLVAVCNSEANDASESLVMTVLAELSLLKVDELQLGRAARRISADKLEALLKRLLTLLQLLLLQSSDALFVERPPAVPALIVIATTLVDALALRLVTSPEGAALLESMQRAINAHLAIAQAAAPLLGVLRALQNANKNPKQTRNMPQRVPVYSRETLVL